MHTTLSLAYAAQQMLTYDSDGILIAEVGALLKVMELGAQHAKKFVLGKLVHDST